MPANADPRAVATFTYEPIDREQPETLHAYFITSRQRTRLAQIDEAMLGKRFGDESLVPLLKEACEIGMVETFEELSDKFTRKDLIAIVRGFPEAVTLTEIEKGKSRWQPLVVPGSSAKIAPAPVEIRPPQMPPNA